MVSNKKIMNWDTELSAEKTIEALVFEIDGGSIFAEKNLTKQDITVLVQIFILGSEI